MFSIRDLRILICDDHPIFVEGIESILDRSSLAKKWIIHLTKTYSGQMALQQIRSRQFDLAIVDLGIPDIDGTELIEHIQAQSPNTKIFVLTGSQNSVILARIHQMQVMGLMLKLNAFEELATAIEQCLQNGKSYLDPQADALLEVSTGQPLSEQEYKVLKFIAEGKNPPEIAEIMNCHRSTVRTYMNRISAKTGARGIADMVGFYLQWNVKGDRRSQP